MGWWPFSGSSDAASSTSQQLQSAPPSIPTPSQTHDSTSTNTPAPHDPDFYAAHPHLAPPSLSTTNPSKATISPSTPQEDLDPSLPRTMSCRAAFDSAFYCSSLGGHFNDIYRYGQLRNCSDHWSDFWFCMRTKNAYMSTEAKERAVRERYREKEVKLKEKPNSEDIWVRRGPGEEVKEPFREAEREWERINGGGNEGR